MRIEFIEYFLSFVGTFWIAKSIIWRSRKQVVRESLNLFDGNPFAFESQILAYFYGWFGLTFIAIAFGLHFLKSFLLVPSLKITILDSLFIASIGFLFDEVLFKKKARKLTQKYWPEYPGEYTDKNY